MYKRLLILAFVLILLGNVFAGIYQDSFEDGLDANVFENTRVPYYKYANQNMAISNIQAHTGTYSLYGNSGVDLNRELFLYDSNTYSVWIYPENINIGGNNDCGILLGNSINSQVHFSIGNTGNWQYYSGGWQDTAISATVGQWWKLEVYYTDGNSNVLYNIYNSSGTRVYSNSAGVYAAGTPTHLKIFTDDASAYCYFDDVNISIPPTPPNTTGIDANYSYTVDFANTEINFTDRTMDTNVDAHVVLDDWNWYVDTVLSSTDQNWTKTGVNEYEDFNVALSVCGDYLGTQYCDYVEKTVSTGKWFGDLIFNFYDDTTKTGLDEVYLEFDGTPYYSDTNTFINIDLQGITSGAKSILMQVTGYQEKEFDLTLTQYTDINYNMGFVSSSNLSTVNFQVFTESGVTKPNTSFFGYDNNNGYLIDIETTDASGRMTFYLNNSKSDYNFISTDLNFGTTTWTINKPKDATTLNEITGNWKYSITGNSYSSGSNIAASIQKILLQNTTNAYYIKIQDVNETYSPAQFGLKSVTSEKTKTLNPYLYPIGAANLTLIKLVDFTTNQPIAEAYELLLSVYTDSNGLIEIGTYVNDSTGTYNIYMDLNELYRLVVDEQTFELRPTLSIYYLYLTQDSGLGTDGNIPTITNTWVDLNSPLIMSQVREYFFGCSASEENCYPSMIFSLIFLVILAIGFSVYLQVGSIEQSILIIVLLGMFTFIGFIPIWLFAVSAVICFMWGVFS